MKLTTPQLRAINNPCFEAEETMNLIFKTFPLMGYRFAMSRILTVNIGME